MPAGGTRTAEQRRRGGLSTNDLDVDQWSTPDVTLPANLTVAIPISSYGVVMFLSHDPAKVYLYKHAL